MPERRRYERTPDTICALAVVTVIAAILTVTGEVPEPVAELVPAWTGTLWSAGLALAAGTSLIGLVLRDPITGWYVELYGRAALALSTLGYAIALIGEADRWETVLLVALAGSLAVSSAWRVVQLRGRISSARTRAAAHRDEEAR